MSDKCYHKTMKQKIMSNPLAIILKFVVVIAFLFSLLISVMEWLFYISAKSPECTELTNSTVMCDPAHYLNTAIIYSAVSFTLLAFIIIIARKETKK